MRPVLEKDVITAWHTYMRFLYLIGGIGIPTKVYFNLSTLAADSRFYFEKELMALARCSHLVEVFNFLIPILEKEI